MNANTIATMNTSTSNIDEEKMVVFEDSTPIKKKASIRVSALPHHIRASALKLDADCDGALDADDIANAITDLGKKERSNHNLKKSIAVILFFCALLIASVFGASITAASLAKDITVDPANGFAYVRGSHTDVMKTSQAVVFKQGAMVGDMSDEELLDLKIITLKEGAIRFDIAGFARNELDDTVILLTVGGSLTYNFEGIVSSTGQARFLLETVFGDEVHVEGSEGQRTLWCTCGVDQSASGFIQSSSEKKKKKKNKKKKN